MLSGAKGASSATLSADEQELLDLFRAGTIKLVNRTIDDPANSGQTMSARVVVDTRMRNRRRDPNPTPAQGSGSAPATPVAPAQPSGPGPQNPPAPPTAPAPAPDPNSSSTGTSGSAPAAPATPAQPNTGQPTNPPTQAGSGTTPAPTAQVEPGIVDKAKAGLAGLFRREPTS